MQFLQLRKAARDKAHGLATDARRGLSVHPLSTATSVDVRRWASMVSYWTMACDHPQKDITRDFPGASPPLSRTACANVARCLPVWQRKFRDGDGYMGGLGGEVSPKAVEEQKRRIKELLLKKDDNS